MIELYRIRNNLQEWDRLPTGYTELPVIGKVRPLDVLKISDNWYVEYQPKGLLVGTFRGRGGKWYRKDQTEQLERAKNHIDKPKTADDKIALNDDDYVLDDKAGWFDVGPFAVRLCMRKDEFHVIVCDGKKAKAQGYSSDDNELRHIIVLTGECE